MLAFRVVQFLPGTQKACGVTPAMKAGITDLELDYLLTEEMKFSKENEEWLRKELRLAVAALDPTGWRKVGKVIVAIGTPIAILAAFLTLSGITIASLIQAFGHIKEETVFRTTTGTRLDKIESSLLTLRISNTAITPNNPASQTEAKAAIAEARKNPNPLPVPVVQQAGTSFVNASKADPKAWEVALDYVSYRSSLNLDERTHSSVITLVEATTYKFRPIPGDHSSGIQLTQANTGVPLEVSARAEYLGEHLNETVHLAPAFLVATGGAISLDSMNLRHVIFVGTKIHYSGKPTILEDVAFINCTFEFDNDNEGRRLADEILSSDRITSFTT